jgi:hypothetical protein
MPHNATQDQAEAPTVTAGQVARAFNVTTKTVQRWNAADILHGVRVGREMRYTQAEIDRLARRRLIGATAR